MIETTLFKRNSVVAREVKNAVNTTDQATNGVSLIKASSPKSFSFISSRGADSYQE
jgi:hypothetical protein